MIAGRYPVVPLPATVQVKNDAIHVRWQHSISLQFSLILVEREEAAEHHPS